jgi:hypothetical protein
MVSPTPFSLWQAAAYGMTMAWPSYALVRLIRALRDRSRPARREEHDR